MRTLFKYWKIATPHRLQPIWPLPFPSSLSPCFMPYWKVYFLSRFFSFLARYINTRQPALSGLLILLKVPPIFISKGIILYQANTVFRNVFHMHFVWLMFNQALFDRLIILCDIIVRECFTPWMTYQWNSFILFRWLMKLPEWMSMKKKLSSHHLPAKRTGNDLKWRRLVPEFSNTFVNWI